MDITFAWLCFLDMASYFIELSVFCTVVLQKCILSLVLKTRSCVNNNVFETFNAVACSPHAVSDKLAL